MFFRFFSIDEIYQIASKGIKKNKKNYKIIEKKKRFDHICDNTQWWSEWSDYLIFQIQVNILWSIDSTLLL